jgi:TPR repeat protein
MKHLQRAELYEQARVQGLGKMTNSNAMYELGREYEHGIGVSQVWQGPRVVSPMTPNNFSETEEYKIKPQILRNLSEHSAVIAMRRRHRRKLLPPIEPTGEVCTWFGR